MVRGMFKLQMPAIEPLVRAVEPIRRGLQHVWENYPLSAIAYPISAAFLAYGTYRLLNLPENALPGDVSSAYWSAYISYAIAPMAVFFATLGDSVEGVPYICKEAIR